MADAVAASAKVNLFLHVTGRRDDGYHLLDSLVVFADVGDQIAVRAADGLTLSVDGPFAEGLPTGPENLVLRAAQALRKHSGSTAGATITLTKNLPVASGIGGGSADAAAALTALNDLWALGVSNAELAAIGLGLGADVPVCLAGRPVFMAGIGEDLTPAPPLPPAWLVLVNPGIAVSTPAVFKARTGEFSAAGRFTEPPADASALAAMLAARSNDLMAPAIRIAPAVGEIIAALDEQPGCLLARMSGSGATCFGLFADAPGACAAAAAIHRARPDWWSVAAVLRS